MLWLLLLGRKKNLAKPPCLPCPPSSFTNNFIENQFTEYKHDKRLPLLQHHPYFGFRLSSLARFKYCIQWDGQTNWRSISLLSAMVQIKYEAKLSDTHGEDNSCVICLFKDSFKSFLQVTIAAGWKKVFLSCKSVQDLNTFSCVGANWELFGFFFLPFYFVWKRRKCQPPRVAKV